ncbi:MAG: sporulation initiation factor Spo0A C-terminal domain-containing protein [Oscillospiraceae bacterium]
MNRTIETVLICDYTEEDGQLFAGLLSQQGYNVNVCEGCSEQELKPQQNVAPDCVIVDEGFFGTENTDLIRVARDIDHDAFVIFMSSEYSDSLKMEINSLENALYLLKPVDAQTVASSLKAAESIWQSRRAVSVRAAVSDKDIEKLLCGLGFSAKLKGFGFLKECIYATLEKPELLGSISKKLYPFVGERLSAAPASVEKNIRASIAMAFREDISGSLRSFVDSDKCPTNGAVIKALYDHYMAAK